MIVILIIHYSFLHWWWYFQLFIISWICVPVGANKSLIDGYIDLSVCWWISRFV